MSCMRLHELHVLHLHLWVSNGHIRPLRNLCFSTHGLVTL